jgi:hypothetical protein
VPSFAHAFHFGIGNGLFERFGLFVHFPADQVARCTANCRPDQCAGHVVFGYESPDSRPAGSPGVRTNFSTLLFFTGLGRRRICNGTQNQQTQGEGKKST